MEIAVLEVVSISDYELLMIIIGTSVLIVDIIDVIKKK